jgi:hypothetical protein
LIWLGVSALVVYSGITGPLPANPLLKVLGFLVTASSLGPSIFTSIFLGSFLFTCITSIKNISRKLESPLNLTSVALDSRLGLKPFAEAALRLTLAYESLLVGGMVGIWSTLLLRGQPLGARLPQFGGLAELSIGGIAIFFVPLIRVRHILVRERRKHLDEINIKRAMIVDPFLQNLTMDIPAIGDQLVALAQMEHIVKRIPGWPFDLRVILKLGLIVGVFALSLFPPQGIIPTIWNLIVRLLGI